MPVKKRYYFVLTLISIAIVGGTFWVVYSLMGGNLKDTTQQFPLWKQYEVGFTTINLPGRYVAHYEYVHGLGNVRGDLNLTSTLFSVDNKIRVDLILRPEFRQTWVEQAQFTAENPPFESSTVQSTDYGIFQNLMDAFPQNFFIVFVGAENVENLDGYNDRFAIINLTRNVDELQFEGSGNIVYELNGKRQILFLDPSQLSKYMEVRKEYTSDTIAFNFTTVEKPEFPIVPPESEAYAFQSRKSYANPIDGNTVNELEIKSSDALSDLTLKNLGYASPGFVVIPSSLTFLVMTLKKIRQK